MMKRTVAILGVKGKSCSGLAMSAVQQDFRLLFISPGEEEALDLKKDLQQVTGSAEVEFISCEREGCWEADVIVLVNPSESDPVLIERIKQVSTQKPVVIISPEKPKSSELVSFNFQDLLPNSQVVELQLNDEYFSIFGKYDKVNQSLRAFLLSAGYYEKKEQWK